ncbi:MAG: T9SS type A sorting domain-containing protein [Saprospiraceae bacterium]|nr:T9SS type A sorting domain-containing protein [Candidatus Vicinibacter affinis]
MKKQLLKKLSGFIVTVLMLSVSANAQIVYTDVNPDTTIANRIYYLDLNNDGTTDDSIRLFVSRPYIGECRGSKVSIFALNGNTVSGSTYPLAMNIKDTISSALTWSASGDLRYIRSGDPTSCPNDTLGYWTNAKDYYLGLKLIVGTYTYYGWLRMQITVDPLYASGIIKDYAYNSIPNQPILAGQTSVTGITENISASSISLYPNPATNYLTITLQGDNKKAEVTIMDITGKIFYSTTENETQELKINTKDFAEGVYLVQVKSEDFMATKKFVVKK